MTTPPQFDYREGELHAEGVALARVAAEVGTPFYCYSSAALTGRYRDFAAACGPRTMICYSVKANSSLAVIRTLAKLGAGADVVSEGELRRALAAGVPAERIVFSGVGKTRGEMALALDAGIRQLNVESGQELELLAETAAARGRTARIAVRVNPDVDARTHAKITTGRAENKFGIDVASVPGVFARARELAAIEPVGVAVHIGSQLLELEPFRLAFGRVAALVRALRDEGHAIRRVDLGGGLGIPYGAEAAPSLEAYAALIREIVGPLEVEVLLEPGRTLVAEAGVLVTRVLYVKQGRERRFVIVDAAMNDLKRPAMYGAYHEIVTVARPAADSAPEPADIVGPVCETGDSFAAARPLSPVAANDLLAICDAGAYGAVMASSYNSRLLVPEVLVDGERFAVVRRRQSYDEMLALEQLPDWLSEAPAGGESTAAKRGVA